MVGTVAFFAWLVAPLSILCGEERAGEPHSVLVNLVREELALRFKGPPLQLTLRVTQSAPPLEQEIVVGFASDGALRLSRSSYGFRHTAHGLSIERTKANSLRTESVHQANWTAEYTTGTLEEGASFNSAMLVSADSTAEKDALAERIREVTPFTYDLRLLGLTIRTPGTRLSKTDWHPIESEQSITSFFESAANVAVAKPSEEELQFSMSIPTASGKLIPASVSFRKIGDVFRLVSIEILTIGSQGAKRGNRVTNAFLENGASVVTTFPQTVTIEARKDDVVLSRTDFHIDREQWDVSFDEDHFALKSLAIPDGVFLRVYGSPIPDFLLENAPKAWNEIADRRDYRLSGGVAKAFVPENVIPNLPPQGKLKDTKISNTRFWFLVGNAILFFVLGCWLLIRAKWL